MGLLQRLARPTRNSSRTPLGQGTRQGIQFLLMVFGPSGAWPARSLQTLMELGKISCGSLGFGRFMCDRGSPATLVHGYPHRGARAVLRRRTLAASGCSDASLRRRNSSSFTLGSLQLRGGCAVAAETADHARLAGTASENGGSICGQQLSSSVWHQQGRQPTATAANEFDMNNCCLLDGAWGLCPYKSVYMSMRRTDGKSDTDTANEFDISSHVCQIRTII